MSDDVKRLVEDLRESAGYVGIGLAGVRAADLIERQATALAEIEALHQPFLIGYGDDDDGLPTYACASCCEATVGTSVACVAEHDHRPGKPICATAAAIKRAREAKP